MQRKTEIVTIRMTPTMKSLVQHLAQKAGMTVTDYMTVYALGKEIVWVDGLDTVLSELKAQGRNLNQLTTLANMGKLKILRGDDLVDGYAKLCEQVSQLAKEVQYGRSGPYSGAWSGSCSNSSRDWSQRPQGSLPRAEEENRSGP